MTITKEAPLDFKADIRTELGKEWAKKARKSGIVPAVVYGQKSEPICLTVNSHDLQMLIQNARGNRRLINLELSDGKKISVFFKDFQREPVSMAIIHVDFLLVNENEPVSIKVPIRHHGGISAGVKLGGLLEQLRHDIAVKAKPADIPAVISVDVTSLGLAQTVHISELPALEDGEYVGDPSTPVFTIAAKGKAAKEALREIIAAERAEALAAAEAAEGEEEGE